MQDMTRAELLQFTPEHYLANGYMTESGLKRPGLSSLFAGLCNASDHVISVGPTPARRTIPRSGFV